MAKPHQRKNNGLSNVVIWVTATIGAILFLWVLNRFTDRRSNVADTSIIVKLQSANHFKSEFPAQRQTFDLGKKVGLRSAALNAIGMEPREVRGMANGDPGTVFAMLSHLGGFGEIIWVDRWTNFPIHLPPTSIPGQVVVPRRDAVKAGLTAIEAAGGCLIKAGENRYLVAKVTEREKYERAIRALGWLDGVAAPWDAMNGSIKSNATGQ